MFKDDHRQDGHLPKQHKKMKNMMKFWIGGMIVMTIQSQVSFAQKIDDDRMRRDIEVAENVLSTLIKQEIGSQRTFWGLDVKGSYQEGYGVTFRLPGDNSMIYFPKGEATVIYSDDLRPGVTIAAPPPHKVPRGDREQDEAREEAIRSEKRTATSLREATTERKRAKSDSLRDEYNKKLIKAAKDFIVDYGDFISQLGPNERIVITNQGESKSWYFNQAKRTHISVEGNKADIIAFKQGKLTRDQAIAKLKVVNTESVETKEQDLELLASIFNRLYRPDLSTTYFSENNLYYERLKDYGALFYMQVYSSYETGHKMYSMSTQNLEDVDEETRDKKVVELYPKFEKELKENILEYGRTLKTLKDEEVLIFNVTLTKCKIKGCGIPSTLELGIKGSVLKDFSMGKIDKDAGIARFSVKTGPKQ
jgi:hypothetical protein